MTSINESIFIELQDEVARMALFTRENWKQEREALMSIQKPRRAWIFVSKTIKACMPLA